MIDIILQSLILYALLSTIVGLVFMCILQMIPGRTSTRDYFFAFGAGFVVPGWLVINFLYHNVPKFLKKIFSKPERPSF